MAVKVDNFYSDISTVIIRYCGNSQFLTNALWLAIYILLGSGVLGTVLTPLTDQKIRVCASPFQGVKKIFAYFKPLGFLGNAAQTARGTDK